MSNMDEYHKPWETWFFQRRKHELFIGRVSELLLSPKAEWRRMNWKLYAKEQRPEKLASSWEEGLTSLREGEWAIAESQRGMTRMKWKLYSWKEGLKGWRRECEEWLQDRRGKHKKKYKDLVWCNLIYQKIFSILGKKGSYKLLVMSRVSCSDEFFIKSLI